MAAFAGLVLLGAVAAFFMHYSAQQITLPQGLIPPPRPPEPPQWSEAWNHVRHDATVTSTALIQAQVEVLRAFLKSYAVGSEGRLNVGNRTTPLQVSEEDIRGCLAGLEPEPSPDTSATFPLPPTMFSGESVRLVDPERQHALISRLDPGRTIREGEPVERAVESAVAGGLLELSEVVFATGRGFAIMQFTFSCGLLCGHGGTLVFERSGHRWTRSNRSCRSYVN